MLNLHFSTTLGVIYATLHNIKNMIKQDLVNKSSYQRTNWLVLQMENMETSNQELEGLFPQKKRVKNPFVPIGIDLSSIHISIHYSSTNFNNLFRF